MRHIFGQAHGKIKLREIIDDERLLILKLGKGAIGEDASNLLGSLILTALQIAAMSRADQSEAARRPCFAYLDEFQNFASESFQTILSEARKFGLSLTLSHQYIAQIDESTATAVFGNVDNRLSFRIGTGDAETMPKTSAA